MGPVATAITKHTRHDITEEHILAATRGTDPLRKDLASVLERAAWQVLETETELARVSSSIADSLAKVEQNLTAGPGQQVHSLNPLGELQSNGPRFDMLIAIRDERIRHLRTIARLWTNHQPDQG
jgi:hypothetical protein